ncbi:hypothetical protein N9937_00085 [bacterium]|nr:hypothetical protein [bacterium]
MDYLQNHCWCSSSHWDGKHYDCRHIVSLNSYQEGYEDDWNALIDPEAESFFDEESFNITFDIYKERGYPPSKKSYYMRGVLNLKPEVLDWLEENVEDRTGEECNKGWCVGSTEYRSSPSTSLSVFFHRKKDAMKFIKTFSKWKKPIHYCQYFTDVRKRLDLETLKYIIK